MGRILVIIGFTLFLGTMALGHKGPVNIEGCHKNTENEVLHCHRNLGSVHTLPDKVFDSLEDNGVHTPFGEQVRTVANVKERMSENQLRLLEFQCCTGAPYLKEETCTAFGYANWNLQKNCSRSPSSLESDLSIGIHRQVRCFECCTGEEVLGPKYCSDRGFNNWFKGKKCGC